MTNQEKTASKRKTGVIVGVIVGLLVVSAVVGFLVWLFLGTKLHKSVKVMLSGTQQALEQHMSGFFLCVSQDQRTGRPGHWETNPIPAGLQRTNPTT